MAGRVFLAIFFLISVPCFATILETGECPLETMSGNPDRLPSSNLKGEAPHPLTEIGGVFPPEKFQELRIALKKMGLDLEPGVEYLQDAKNALHGIDQWKKDYRKVLEDPQNRKAAEAILLSFLQNPPPQVDGSYHYHPGLSDERPLPRKDSLEEYLADGLCISRMETIARTLENTMQFRSVLEADKFLDPARRSRYITQMRGAYVLLAMLRERLSPHRGGALAESD